MESNASGYLLNHATLHSVYYEAKEDDGLIDLGLSLRTQQPEAYHTSGKDDYGDMIDWNQFNPQLKKANMEYPKSLAEDCDDETEGVQSKERWAYVKVNMDGVIIGRKICMLDHMGYSSLALKLEDMFGKQSKSGLRLFQAGSEFSLFYKDRDDNWRTVGDIPWKEFVDCVKRIRIVRKE
ncbi:auxin-responsive protein IAA32-like [Cornus florida]|uniref:auxin-responsive protein IAA32-like n=1 Tax=Cornus florida TaxID=4283 RepID=UPI00289BD26C|nr:auxin-responsive protein IAA32-like [Cornus florida]